MSTPTKSPASHPAFGGKGQASPPKFKEDDLVHVLAPSTTSSSSKLSTPTKPLPTSTASPRLASQKQIDANTIPEYVRKVTWRVTGVNPSITNQVEHTYDLQPTNTVHIIVPESRILATRFLPGDIVKSRNGVLYEVWEVRFARNHEGKVVQRYALKDELGSEMEFWDGDVEKADKEAWFPMR